MPQETVWDSEYKKSKFLTKDNKPQSDIVRFIKFLSKNNFIIEGKQVLDLDRLEH
jgi:hypothetical protein